jgi:Zinc carboxypeptidase
MTLRAARQAILVFALLSSLSFAQKVPKITSPKDLIGFGIGDDYHMASYSQLETLWKKWATESDRMKLVEIGKTAENRPQYMCIISTPENLRKLEQYKEISRKLSLAEGLTDEQAHELARQGKTVIWIDGGLHASETVGSQQLIETVYQLISRTDPETMRLLTDSIVLAVQVNPDGEELIANWYMRDPDETKRSLAQVPFLYQKYVGHDNNRDSYMSNMPETINMNRQLYIEWMPQIVYNHHQTGPAGSIVFVPPFRDPFNYNYDPLVPIGIEQVGSAMHARLVAQGKGGSAMRSAANYSTWWNGGVRTTPYFHNQIGLLTEITGGPTPMDIVLAPSKQVASGDWPLPIAPQKWHYRQSIDYDVELNYAVLDFASRNRETLLFNIYRMGKNSIERGNQDYWTITPKRLVALQAAAKAKDPKVQSDPNAEGNSPGGLGVATAPAELYAKVLHDPAFRDPRGYIITANQDDFPTAVKFVDSLLKNGITVMKATAPFDAAGKSYPAGSYVVKTAQAFRPFVRDMFEPQDHPNDFRYPGGPPNRPYDITGWTLALQMGVAFDRVMEGFDGPFKKVTALEAAPQQAIEGPANPAGYLISHKVNNSFIAVNRLLKNNCDVYWLNKDSLGAGTIWVPASNEARTVLTQAAKDLGLTVHAVSTKPAGDALKLKPVRIGLVDVYGGNSPTGWTRWLFEQFEFPYEIVYPADLDAGNLASRFDVIVLPHNVFGDDWRFNRAAMAALAADPALNGTGMSRSEPDPKKIPEEYHHMLGHITAEKTIPQLKQFVQAGGSVIAVGSATALGAILGLPVKDHLTEMDKDGKERHLPAEKFYIPGSLLRAKINNADPLAYGMPDEVDIFYDNSQLFRLAPDASAEKTNPVVWFSGKEPLVSGWAWGQQYLDGGTAVAESSVGEGKVLLLGPDVMFRGQPHATFKLLFNGLYYGSAKSVALP